MSHAEILEDFPELTEQDILACLEFAADREHHLVAMGSASWNYYSIKVSPGMSSSADGGSYVYKSFNQFGFFNVCGVATLELCPCQAIAAFERG